VQRLHWGVPGAPWIRAGSSYKHATVSSSGAGAGLLMRTATLEKKSRPSIFVARASAFARTGSRIDEGRSLFYY